jgi:hypothetical protein
MVTALPSKSSNVPTVTELTVTASIGKSCSSTVVPPCASPRTHHHTSRRDCGSRPVVGSSRRGLADSRSCSSRCRGGVGDPARVVEVAELRDLHEVLTPGEDLVRPPRTGRSG